jgi:gluconate kinase
MDTAGVSETEATQFTMSQRQSSRVKIKLLKRQFKILNTAKPSTYFITTDINKYEQMNV